MHDLTRLLEAAHRGDRHATVELLPLVYDELRKLAATRMAAERPGDTLQPTALVHEDYLRLVGPADGKGWENRSHFFAVAAKAMRQIIIDYARWASRKKRGGGIHKIGLDGIDVADEERAGELVAIDAALTRLESVSARLARLVELRFFAGLTVEEAAETLAVPPHQIKREWRKARAFLFQAMQELT